MNKIPGKREGHLKILRLENEHVEHLAFSIQPFSAAPGQEGPERIEFHPELEITALTPLLDRLEVEAEFWISNPRPDEDEPPPTPGLRRDEPNGAIDLPTRQERIEAQRR